MVKAMDVLINAANAGYLKVLKANLTQDTFSVIKSEEGLENGLSDRVTSISGYFTGFADAQLLHPDYQVDFRSFCSLPRLSSFFRNTCGKGMHNLNYRRKSADGYRWSVMEIFPAEDYSPENETVYIAVKDIQESMNHQAVSIGEVLRALCIDYDSIYCLDLETSQIQTYRSFDHNNPAFFPFLKSNPTYSDLIARYIATSVLPEDRRHVTRITDQGFIREYLDMHATFSGEFRTVYDGVVHWYRITYARLNQEGALRYVAISLSDISDQKRIESDLYRQSKTILLADGNAQHIAELREILGGKYRILCAASGAEVMTQLLSQHEDIAVIIADPSLPDMELRSLVQRIKAEHLYRSIPILVSRQAGSAIQAEDLLTMGASDFITRPFTPSVVLNRVQFMVKYRESSNMLRILERDPLTRLYAKEAFFRTAEQIMQMNPEKQYAILVSDIEQFHFYKERYGMESAEALLRSLAMLAPDMLNSYLIGGRLSDDVFVSLVRFSSGLYEEIHAMQDSINRLSGIVAKTQISVKYGLYVVDEDIPIPSMCDRAMLAVKSIKGVYGKNLAEFDFALRDQLAKTQLILENAEKGLNEHQFAVFYQSKHDIHTGEISGAEAVIRWQHPTMGFMSPVSFIPLFEKNGFIEILDRFVLEQVCRDIQEWQQKGEKIVPISFNVSRVDFDKAGLAERILDTVDSCGIDHSLIHIEITESGYAKDSNAVLQEITKLHNAGFVIELDDFGTGYSSLSALSALPVDVLKLDMSLLQQDSTANTRNILDFSVKLGKIMNLKIVQEGVETREQLERVFALGCDYVQGYFFSRPLPKEKFLAYCHGAGGRNQV